MQNTLPNMNFNQSAIFLDFDGTLVDLQPTPDAVIVSNQLRQMLLQLNDHTQDALALVSGRSIESIDQLIKLPNVAVSGSHGMQFRLAQDAPISLHPQVTPLPKHIIISCEQFCAQHQLLLEHKPLSIALHYRSHPQRESQVEQFLDHLIADLPDLEIQTGKFIRELKPRGIDKASALEYFVQQPRFSGRTPWYFGDDVTDEHAFAWVKQHQGISVKVGEGQSCADYRLQSPQQVLEYFLMNLKSEEQHAR
ncbi:trehalose 6-phosphatase [Vibrio xiamenensis]|uniref:Trehalose 6-phosphate phosphatase n=1 Tax=Vibrio xiamenensis TaxID=861298 RepID=A0A1G8H6J4_9VIBR|nr:trehalose-phosphatase [Vibrio xiamenensis]SDI02179.1 trehalose 6-phosphatase [Vibrio xiamenensis]